MSPTTEHLRARLSAELDDLGPLPDLAPGAARAGARTLRRRRLAAGSALGVVAVGGGAVVTAQRAPQESDGVAVSPSASPSVDPTADGTVTTGEWHETVRGTLESVLPARYGTTATAPAERNRAQLFTTSGGDPRLQMHVSVQGREAANGTSGSCPSQGRARPLLSCAETELDGGWFAVATTELTGATGDGGAAAYGTSLLFLNDGVFFQLSAEELGWDGIEPNQPAGLTADELVAMAEAPAFLDMVRVGVEWKLDQPDSPDNLYDGTDPVWPTP